MDYKEIYTEISIENIENIMTDIIDNYCHDQGVDRNEIPPSIWLDIIDTIHNTIFKNTRILKANPCPNNDYDKDKVMYVYNIYRSISHRNKQLIQQKIFLDMTGIDKQTLYNWSENLSSTRFDLHEKIMEDNEQCLEMKLIDKSTNPMKVLPILNRRHGWSLPGVSKETTKQTRISRQDVGLIDQKESQTIIDAPQLPE